MSEFSHCYDYFVSARLPKAKFVAPLREANHAHLIGTVMIGLVMGVVVIVVIADYDNLKDAFRRMKKSVDRLKAA